MLQHVAPKIGFIPRLCVDWGLASMNDAQNVRVYTARGKDNDQQN